MTVDLEIPRDAVRWHTAFAGDEQYGIWHGVHVFVLNDVDAVRAASGDPDAHGWSSTYDEPDAGGVGAVILLYGPVPLALIAHEVTHVVLHWARSTATPHDRARRWLEQHPEEVAEVIGNLTAVLWYSIPEELLER